MDSLNSGTVYFVFSTRLHRCNVPMFSSFGIIIAV